MGEMLKSLKEYYQGNRISPLDFRCPHWEACSKGNPKITEAKSAFVGTGYEKGVLPRLLFLSLDPGESDREPEQRTVEHVRYLEEHKCDVHKLPQQRHWYRTHELAWILLEKVGPIREEDSHLYFAHVNSVKCSMNNHKQAKPQLFKNCREYIGGEVTILEPDILVTQGKWAKEAVENEKVFKILPGSEDNQVCSYIKWVHIGGKQTLWFHTYHPRNFGMFNKQRRYCFKNWAEYVYTSFSEMNRCRTTASARTNKPLMRACRPCCLTK
ncbi:MAG: uracil-DNA glycosylase family protein [Syntrophobacteraceae bacterium]|jgi:hypothetical protein